MSAALRRITVLCTPFAAAFAVVGCGGQAPVVPSGLIAAVGAENQYANVISQIGGRDVSVTAVESNPNTDPHAYEASPSVARLVSSARVVVQNGLGYDSYMDKIENASADSRRRVIDVQRLLGLPDSTPNPHLWYEPGTMAAVAKALSRDLGAIEPANAPYFQANLKRFDRSLNPWYDALKAFAARYPKTQVATTEPVADYMLAAADAVDLTPFSFQADVMNGVDPAPQSVSLEDSLFSAHRVRVLVYNQQVTDSLTQSFISAAKKSGIPVVGVYETMPTGYRYQSWMLAEVAALQRAVAHRVSTQKL